MSNLKIDIQRTFKSVIFCPVLTIFVIPLFIFTSLFFVPDGYNGSSKFSQTMQGSYENKWLFDLLGFYSIFIFILSFIRYLIFGLPNDTKNAIVKIFLLRSQDGDLRTISFLPYLNIFLVSIPIYLYFFGEAINENRYIGDFNRSVFANFFIFYTLKCLPTIFFTYTLIQSIEVKNYVLQRAG